MRHEDDDHCKDPDCGSRGEVNCATVTRAGLSSHHQDQHSSNPCNNILSVGPLPTCVTCVNMDKCVTGAWSILLAVWAFDYLMTEGDLFSIQHRVGTRLQWRGECEAGVRGNCPLCTDWPHGHPMPQMMAARALTFNTGNLGWLGLSSLWLLRLSVSPQLCQDHRGGNISHVRADTGPGLDQLIE